MKGVASRSSGQGLRIAFHALLKPPGHPVPSGDRLMARMLIRCIGEAGHSVVLASEMRARLANPADVAGWTALQQAAATERARIADAWQRTGPPDLWFCYHPYYKSPDLLGPELSHRFGLPYVTCEASLSSRRKAGVWGEMQRLVQVAVQQAVINLCLTARDAEGLTHGAPDARIAMLAPFIDATPFDDTPCPEPGHLVTVAMMRAGDKLESYRHLAAALALLPDDLPWRLSVAGDGPAKSQVRAMFKAFPAGQITWAGALDRPEVAALLARAVAFVWPGVNEAYGLAYLEAQAAGLPVVAFDTAGVPEVVRAGLVATGDAAGLAARLAALLRDPDLARQQGEAARDHVRAHHSAGAATRRLAEVLASATEHLA